MQGALRKYRSKAAAGFTRNYTHLWERMVQLKGERGRKGGAGSTVQVEAGAAKDGSAAPEDGVVTVCVLGKGGSRAQLEIPAEVDGDVEYLERLPYPVRKRGRREE